MVAASQKINGIDLVHMAEQYIHCRSATDNIASNSDRDQMVHQTTKYLIEGYDCPQIPASLIAVQAVANLDCLHVNAYINIDLSTSKCLILQVAGQARAVSLIDILTLFDDQPQLLAANGEG